MLKFSILVKFRGVFKLFGLSKLITFVITISLILLIFSWEWCQIKGDGEQKNFKRKNKGKNGYTFLLVAMATKNAFLPKNT